MPSAFPRCQSRSIRISRPRRSSSPVTTSALTPRTSIRRHHHPRTVHQRRRGYALHELHQLHTTGTSAITVTFQTGYDLNIAAVDVQNRVASVQGRLPAVVNNTGITITKANSNFVLAAGFISPDHSLSQDFISNYIDVYISDALKRVPGVGAVVIFGERKYAMRLWLDPNRLRPRLTALDVTNALA